MFLGMMMKKWKKWSMSSKFHFLAAGVGLAKKMVAALPFSLRDRLVAQLTSHQCAFEVCPRISGQNFQMALNFAKKWGIAGKKLHGHAQVKNGCLAEWQLGMVRPQSSSLKIWSLACLLLPGPVVAWRIEWQLDLPVKLTESVNETSEPARLGAPWLKARLE